MRKFIFFIVVLVGLLYYFREYIPYQHNMAKQEIMELKAAEQEKAGDVYWVTQADYNFINNYNQKNGPSLSIKTPGGVTIEYETVTEVNGYRQGKPIYIQRYVPKKPIKIIGSR